MSNYGYIYLTENKIDGKKYIGMHKSNIFDHTYYGTGKIIKQALKKYGKENFTCIILEWGESKEDLQEKERKWIEKYSASNNSDFYNISIGGTGDFERSQETKNKLRTAFMGENNPAKRPEVREKIRLSKLGDKNPMKREDVKLKNSASLKKWHEEHDDIGQEVINLTTGEKYKSVKEASKRFKVNILAIYTCCIENLFREKEYYRQIKGNILIFPKNFKPNENTKIYKEIKERVLRRLENGNIGRSKRKKVIDKTTGKIYNSTMEAERDTGCFSSNISACCKGKIKQTKGHEWSYV